MLHETDPLGACEPDARSRAFANIDGRGVAYCNAVAGRGVARSYQADGDYSHGSSGLAPEEVETRVTQPIEGALMGVAGLTPITFKLGRLAFVGVCRVRLEHGHQQSSNAGTGTPAGRAGTAAGGSGSVYDTGGLAHGRDPAGWGPFDDQRRRAGIHRPGKYVQSRIGRLNGGFRACRELLKF